MALMHARGGKSAPLLFSTCFGGLSDPLWLTPLLVACPDQGDLHSCTCAMVYRSSECFPGGACDNAEEEIQWLVGMTTPEHRRYAEEIDVGL